MHPPSPHPSRADASGESLLSPPEDTTEASGDVIIDGVAASPGIAIGPAYLLKRESGRVEAERIDPAKAAHETERFEKAISQAERALSSIISVTREKLGEESSAIFEAQQLMLRDDALYKGVVHHIEDQHSSASYAIDQVMTRYRQRLEGSDSPYLRQRSDDLLEVQQRLITYLRRGKLLADVPPDTIIISQALTAAKMMLFSRRGILGCGLDYSGPTSHVAIMARALGLPAVVSLHDLSERVETGDMIVLDGIRGRVVLRPSDDTLRIFQKRNRRFQEIRTQQRELAPLPAETTDGVTIDLHANIEIAQETDLLDDHGADGIGLVRTEVLLLLQGSITQPEDVQYKLYRQIVEAAAPRPTTIRVMDLGGDKMLPLARRENNPFLGWRGIRVLLDKPDLLLPQLRALLRCAQHGPVRLLLPMVTTRGEVQQVHKLLDTAREELASRHVPFEADLPVGIMVEVPSVALQADVFAEVCDFFSIGSNDLTQYTLAVDRGNDLVADRYSELHPAVLTLIKRTTDAARAAGIPVSVCGEVAGNPMATPILLGLGVDQLSASPIYIPGVKRLIRRIAHAEARSLVRKALDLHDAEDVQRLLTDWFHTHVGHLPLGLDGETLGAHGPQVASS